MVFVAKIFVYALMHVFKIETVFMVVLHHVLQFCFIFQRKCFDPRWTSKFVEQDLLRLQKYL